MAGYLTETSSLLDTEKLLLVDVLDCVAFGEEHWS